MDKTFPMTSSHRMSRMITRGRTFYLSHQKILSRPVLYLSEYFARSREAYFGHLHGYHSRAEVLPWLKFFFDGVAQVASDAIEDCKVITKLRERDLAKVSALGKAAPNAVVALKSLFKNPIASVKSLEESTGLSWQNANNLIKKLVGCLILVPSDSTVEYGRTFIYKDYLDVFNKPKES